MFIGIVWRRREKNNLASLLFLMSGPVGCRSLLPRGGAVSRDPSGFFATFLRLVTPRPRPPKAPVVSLRAWARSCGRASLDVGGGLGVGNGWMCRRTKRFPCFWWCSVGEVCDYGFVQCVCVGEEGVCCPGCGHGRVT